MNRVGLLVFIFFAAFLLSKRASGQNISNEGTDFWAVFPTHAPVTATSLADIKIYLTSKYNTEATITCGTFDSGPITIAANTSVGVIVPRFNAYIDLGRENEVLTNKGIHIKVTEGHQKVSAYAHIFAGRRSAASLILPFETLGQQYYSVNYTQTSVGNNFLVLTAVEDNTELILHQKNGGDKAISLPKAGDVYEYISGGDDLTGVFVEVNTATSSCKRFAAFSGSSAVGIGDCTTVSGFDPLYQQLYPLSSLGKNYGIAPFRDQSYLYRAVATENNTKIYQDGNLLTTLSKGEFYTSGRLVEGAFVTSDKNFIVSQYMYSESCASIRGARVNAGDPDMVILNPMEFSIKEITVFSSKDQAIGDRYINVLIKANKASTFRINNIIPDVTWVPLPGNSAYVYGQIAVEEASLTLSAADGFNAIAYGYGQTESYAYSAGTNLATNNYLTVVNQNNKFESPNGCIGENIGFKVNLPYAADRIIWTLENSSSEVENNPVPEVITANGQTSYVYRYSAGKLYSKAGEYHLEVLAHVPNSANNCISGDITSNYVFNIYDLPTAKFQIPESDCGKKDIVFTDQSISNSTDFAITDWLWDFGDGETSTLEKPTHQYAKEGTYTVTLSVKSGSGCSSDPLLQLIKIYPVAKANFTALNNTCIQTDLALTDHSTISNGSIVNWHWDFGDGSNIDQPTSTTVIHQYSNSGTYSVKLTVTSDKGCLSEVLSKDVIVTALPVVDFSMPDVCLSDAIAVFQNKSVDVAGGNGTFTYEWNFGDANATASNPNRSTEQNGKHKFVAAGIYQVQLRITNSNGCTTSKTQAFTVNGGVESAAFSIQNENNLCSNTDVILNNQSKAIFGRITRIEIYKDFINQPNTFETINYPTAADVHLTYPVFGGMSTKSFKIRLIAYSGESCFKSVEKTVTLKPAPILTFSDVAPVCKNDGTVLLKEATENSSLSGTGVYSGEGIDESGNFNPKQLQASVHIITYTFTATNGCSASISKSIQVNESPSADAGATLYILAGGEVKIPAVAEGNGLTYKWTPAKGLNHDNVLNPVASPDQDTEYHLLVTTADGCLTTTYVQVKVLQMLNPPNSFTPNGDGINDFWSIKYLESYPNATVEVYSRNGQRVYYSLHYNTPFDGNFQNVPLPVGVYYYIINPRNGRKIVTGPLTIIR